MSTEQLPLRTVQWMLEEAVAAALRFPVAVVGASRTDAGVHAEGQVASFACPAVVPAQKLSAALNSRLPKDVQVRAAFLAPESFDPISQCVSKRYRYTLRAGCRHGMRPNPFETRYVASVVHDMDIGSMRRAAAMIVGKHDFKGFAHQTEEKLTTVRTIHACEIDVLPDGAICIVVEGDGFLYNMVRIIVGTLVEIGRGRFAAEVISEIIRTTDRGLAGPTMPPEGLCLEWIRYPEQTLAVDTQP